MQGSEIQPTQTMQNPTATSSVRNRSDATFGLRFIFGIVIGCSVFFGLFSLWPPLAITLALILTPAIIRTGNIENAYRFNRTNFGWRKRTTYFIYSVGMMMNTALLAAAAFAATCLVCSLFGYGFGQLFDSSLSTPLEFAFVGATGGAVWGITCSLITIGWYWNKNWLPEIDFNSKEEAC